MNIDFSNSTVCLNLVKLASETQNPINHELQTEKLNSHSFFQPSVDVFTGVASSFFWTRSCADGDAFSCIPLLVGTISSTAMKSFDKQDPLLSATYITRNAVRGITLRNCFERRAEDCALGFGALAVIEGILAIAKYLKSEKFYTQASPK